MNFRKDFITRNKKGFNLLFLMGLVISILIVPLVFLYCQNSYIRTEIDWKGALLSSLLSVLVFFGLIFPSLCRLHYYSFFLYRLSILFGTIIPILFAIIFVAMGLISIEFFIIPLLLNTGIFWLIIVIAIWLYEGYLISKKPK
jgi:hypothetical protein